MSDSDTPGALALFIDTGAFYARFVETAQRHERATSVFKVIGTGDAVYRPLYTSTYVLDELATLILSHRNHKAATTAIEWVQQSATIVFHPDETDFDAALDQFHHYDDHEISFTDHMSGVLAAERDIKHMFTFDPDHFRTLGFTVVPEDTGAITLAAGLAGCADDDDGDGNGDDGDENGGGEYFEDEPEYDDWFDDVDTYEGTLDMTGEEEVTVMNGAGETGMRFDPPAILVDAGTTVVWEWTGEGGSHDVTHADGEFQSDTQDGEGETFEHTFEDDGIHRYYCTPHQANGQKGAVVVQ